MNSGMTRLCINPAAVVLNSQESSLFVNDNHTSYILKV